MRLIASIVTSCAAALVACSCASTPAGPVASGSPLSTTSNTAAITSEPPRPVPIIPLPPTYTRQAKWIDLQVGDCLTTPPPSDPGIVDVQLTNCQVPHAAEVFLRTQVAVNDAIAGVADQRCAAGLTLYAPQHGRFTSTYLIDSNMDRTGHTALPSTVICLLQSADGQPLSGSARS